MLLVMSWIRYTISFLIGPAQVKGRLSCNSTDNNRSIYLASHPLSLQSLISILFSGTFLVKKQKHLSLTLFIATYNNRARPNCSTIFTFIFWHYLRSPLSSFLAPSFWPRRIDRVLYLAFLDRHPKSR